MFSNTELLSCNFAKVGKDKAYFDSYTIVSYGDAEIACIGITIPGTISSSNPAQFKNEEGEISTPLAKSTPSRKEEFINEHLDKKQCFEPDSVLWSRY